MNKTTAISIAVSGIDTREELLSIIEKVEMLSGIQLDQLKIEDIWSDIKKAPISSAVKPFRGIWNERNLHEKTSHKNFARAS